MFHLDHVLLSTQKQAVAASPCQEDSSNWLLSFIGFKTDTTPLSREDSDRVYTELQKGDLPPESLKVVMTVLGPLIPLDAFVVNAIADGNEDLALKLLTNDLIQSQGQSFLEAACGKGLVKVVQKLFESGHVDVNKRDHFGQSPLHRTCGEKVDEKRLTLIELLLKAGAQVNDHATGSTPLMELLHCKAENPIELQHQISAVKLLLDAGAQVNIRNHNNDSPLDITDSSELSALLQSYGASFYAEIVGSPKSEGDKKSKFLLGHYNSIEGYNSSKNQCAEIAKMMKALPEPFSLHLTDEEKQQLLHAFRNGTNINDREETISLIQNGHLSILPLGYPGHAMYLVFCNGYLAILNRGDGVPKTLINWPKCIQKRFSTAETIKAYKIDPQALTPEIFSQIIAAENATREDALKFYYETLPSLLSPREDKKPVQDTVCKQLESLRSKVQKIGNCAFTQAKLSARVAKAMIHIKVVDGKSTLAKKDVYKAYAFSKDFSSHIRLTAMDRYLANHVIGPDDTADQGLLMQTYAKLRKRLAKFPDLKFYPNFKKWAEKLEELRLQDWSRQVDKLAPLYT